MYFWLLFQTPCLSNAQRTVGIIENNLPACKATFTSIQPLGPRLTYNWCFSWSFHLHQPEGQSHASRPAPRRHCCEARPPTAYKNHPQTISSSLRVRWGGRPVLSRPCGGEDLCGHLSPFCVSDEGQMVRWNRDPSCDDHVARVINKHLLLSLARAVAFVTATLAWFVAHAT